MEISALPSRLDKVVLPVLQILVRESHMVGNLVAVPEGCFLAGATTKRVDNCLFKCWDQF